MIKINYRIKKSSTLNTLICNLVLKFLIFQLSKFGCCDFIDPEKFLTPEGQNESKAVLKFSEFQYCN